PRPQSNGHRHRHPRRFETPRRTSLGSLTTQPHGNFLTWCSFAHIMTHQNMSFERRACLFLAIVTLTLLTSAPASGQTSGDNTSVTGPLSGYMDFHFNKEENSDALLDFHRFVMLFNHSFTDRIRFVGELEVEHAFVEGLEESGEVELEQAYL